MALVSKVITPFFFSEKEPYMFVLFVEEFENKFRTAVCSNPRYIVVYDVRKIYPELTISEAKKCFTEEMRVGHREEINLRKFTISDLTNNEYSSVQFSSTYGKEECFRIGTYDNFDERETAKMILNLLVKHRLLRLSN